MKLLLFLILGAITFGKLEALEAPPLPSKSGSWLSEKPLTWNELKGKVVLINVWTFACWNSYNSFEWLVSLHKKYPDLMIIGIHSPEFDYEKDRAQMRQTMSKYLVDWPQVLDDNHDYWKKLNNRYWPAFYVVDKQGQIRGKFTGETHAQDSQAAEIEQMIQTLSRE